MADKGLALIFGPGKKGSKTPPEHDDMGEDDLGEEHDHEEDEKPCLDECLENFPDGIPDENRVVEGDRIGDSLRKVLG